MRHVTLAIALSIACAAGAADWRPLASPPEHKATTDLDQVKSKSGMVQFMVRRVFATPETHSSGKEVHSVRVHYLGNCKANTAVQVLQQNYGADRKLIDFTARKTVKRSEMAPLEASSDVAQALTLACERTADVGGKGDSAAGKGRTRSSSGTGIVVTREGHVLTNEHVVRQCDAIELVDETNARYKATLKASDRAKDLALLSAEARSADVAIFRKDPVPRLGESVTIVGFPLVGVLGTRPSVGFGHVASVVGVKGNPAQMQISVPVQRGHSGGPVLDQSGHVIGVVVSKLDALKLAERVGDLAQNVNFAIRGDTVRAFLDAQRAQILVGEDSAKLENTDLAKKGASVTVRVRCLRQSTTPTKSAEPKK